MLVIINVAVPVFANVRFCVGLVVLTGTDPNETLVSETPATPWVRSAEKAIVPEPERTASAIMVARRIPVFRRTWRSAQAGKHDRSSLQALPVGSEGEG
jgi:hypothetical protein